MTIPTASNYPDAFDDDDNLFEAHDGLRLSLREDYEPGDTTIYVEGPLNLMTRFPDTGIITLTEQCSDIDKRAISFYYDTVDVEAATISGLELLPGFSDVIKPKRITNVTQNVMARHHNHLKDALIAIQNFIGVKGTVDLQPFGPTLEGRINFLRKLVLVPKAWFTVNKRQGIVPLEVEFTERAFRLGTDGTAGPVTITWDFGDQTTSVISFISTISATDEVDVDDINVYVRDDDGGTITKTYTRPGTYTVKMKVVNDFGEDELILDDLIRARVKAPNEAVMKFVHNTSTQISTPGVPPDGPYDTPPQIRSPINTLIRIEVPEGENPATPGYSYGGEVLDEDGEPLDPIDLWTWGISDDMTHEDYRTASASFSIGGIYDLKLRVDTVLGAYRITSYDNVIDVVENQNLWLWVYQNTNNVKAYEYGLLSETFKLTSTSTLTANRNESFLEDAPNEEQQQREFRKNASFAPRTLTQSGQRGTCMLYWASGRNASDSRATEQINVVEYEGFSDTYVSHTALSRPWNWFHWGSTSRSYFFGGSPTTEPLPNTSPTNTTLLSQDHFDLTSTTDTFLESQYLNGAEELESNVALFSEGDPIYGHFSVYRTAWKDSTGYLARNDAVGPFFRIASFYRTSGTTSEPVQYIEKMMDIQGQTKYEGELTDLSQGIYFFNNSGSVSVFDPSDAIWRTGGPGVNSVVYRTLQDTTVEGFDDQTNTLLVASDHDKRAYITFDYSNDTFLKFNELDTTFSTLGSRPSGEQWMLGMY